MAETFGFSVFPRIPNAALARRLCFASPARFAGCEAKETNFFLKTLTTRRAAPLYVGKFNLRVPDRYPQALPPMECGNLLPLLDDESKAGTSSRTPKGASFKAPRAPLPPLTGHPLPRRLGGEGTAGGSAVWKGVSSTFNYPRFAFLPDSRLPIWENARP
jgi:hypothetical protein